MRRKSSLWRLSFVCAGLLALSAAVSAQTAEVLLADDTPLTATTPSIQGRVPVLFVHGHNDTDGDTDFNYRQNWQQQLRGLSFKQVLDANPGLGLEPYYIRFREQNRSITVDAAEITDAIDLILHRHDPNYAYPVNWLQSTHVKVVVIAYSKGTISTRQSLKMMQTERPDFHPVSEFIAIAPPNHGIGTRVFSTTTNLAVRQLYNGYRPHRVVADNCGTSFGEAAATDYIQLLNGHPITDTLTLEATDSFPDEAPGSRIPGDQAAAGTLYVTMFDALDRDLVGGDVASSDCQGRVVALNLAPNAVNIPISGITDDGWETIPDLFVLTDAERKAVAVHQNSVHTPEVICQALYVSVYHRSPVGQTCSADANGLPVIPLPPRAAAMLTLDFSGSMSALAGAGGTRAEVLKDAVELFIQLWSAVGVPSDRIGVNYFRTNVEPFDLSGDTLPPLSSGGPAIITNLGNQQPHDRTAMGNGLQRAIEILRDSAGDSQERRVLLFTDGLQNVNPMARIMNGQLQFFNQAGRPNSNVSPTAPAVLDPALGIAVDTIGIGNDAALVGLLDDIAGETGGRALVTSAPNDDLRRFFIEQLINGLRGFSPQLVAYRHGAVGAKGSTEAFGIEDGPRKLVLKVSWKRGQEIDFSVTRNGVDVTSAGHFINGAFYKIFVIDFPARGTITARGNWQIRMKGKAATAYQAAAIVDGGRITYDAIFNAKRARLGDPLDLTVMATAEGKPIAGGARIKITLMSPTAAARDILANFRPKELPVFEPGTSLAERRMLALAQDPRKWAALKPKQQTLLVKRTEKGDFRARFRPQVPGVYTALVTIDGEAAKLGQFSRTMTVTAVVRRKGTPTIGR